MDDPVQSPQALIERTLQTLWEDKTASHTVHFALEQTLAEYPRTSTQFPYRQMIISFQGRGGLCNRLITLWSALAISQILEIPILINWKPGPPCASSLHDLYQINFSETTPLEIILQKLQQHLFQTIYLARVSGDRDRVYHVWNLKQFIDLDQFRNKYLEVARGFQIQEQLNQQIKHFVDQFWDPTIVGIHIRKTDLIPMIARNHANHRTCYDEDFVEAIAHEIRLGTRKFFLATDNQETQDQFTRLFPNHMVYFCQDFKADEHRHTPVQDAIVDLYLLSKTNRIIGTQHSSFSTQAALLGNIPLKYANQYPHAQ